MGDKEPDERIYIDPIPVLFFIGVFFLCWNRCSPLKSNCSICCALSKKKVKEDLSPNYGTDLDEVTSVVEVGDTNPEYEGVDGGQGTRATDNHSNNTQATGQNPDYEPSSIYASMYE